MVLREYVATLLSLALTERGEIMNKSIALGTYREPPNLATRLPARSRTRRTRLPRQLAGSPPPGDRWGFLSEMGGVPLNTRIDAYLDVFDKYFR